MIRVTDINGRTQYLAPAAIARVVEAGPSSQWHGIRCIVHLFDGKVVEAQERADEIFSAIDAMRGVA